jgi:polyhydroxybutyrate depolymerase
VKLFLFIFLFGAAVLAAIRALVRLIRGRAPLRPAPPGQLVSQRIRVGRMDRRFLIYIPSTYGAEHPLPLVLAFHGGGGTAERMAARTAIHVLAQEEEFIAVYPQGTGFRPRRGATWNAGGDPPQGSAERRRIDDVGFVRQLVAQVTSLYAVDKSHIYAMGLSKGGMLAYYLACRLSDTIAAIGVVAGTMTATRCKPSSKVAIMHIHGTVDQNVPFEGGRGARTAPGAHWPPVARGLEYWRRHNGCEPTPRLVQQRYTMKCWQYDAPGTGADVRFCLIEGGGHSWPGSSNQSGKRREDLSGDIPWVTRALWDFFVKHPKASVGSGERTRPAAEV